MQTNVSTYRHLEGGEEWIPSCSNMNSLRNGLISGNKVDILYVPGKMMKRNSTTVIDLSSKFPLLNFRI